MSINQAKTCDDILSLETLRSAITEVGDDLSLSQLVAFLTIAIEPGLSVNELADRIGLPQQSASRHASVLLGRYQSISGEPRIPLILQGISGVDSRKRALFLTEHGELLAKRIAAILTLRNGGKQ